MSPDLGVLEDMLGVNNKTVKKVLASWGPGKFDAELNLDGKAFRPDGKTAATLLPLDGDAGVEHWITFQNFYVISRYNRSPLYSMAVWQLSQEIARGLANYSSAEARLIARKPSSQIAGLLGFANEPELIHRDNLVLS